MKTYTKEQITKILKLHDEWIKGKADGTRANLYNADLSNADLSKANLSNADLSKANLSKADLSKADLSKADLYYADLSKANLYNADLSKANLSKVESVVSFTLGCHFGYAWKKDEENIVVKIGCEEHSIKTWLKRYKFIATKNNYNIKSTNFYLAQLKIIKKYF